MVHHSATRCRVGGHHDGIRTGNEGRRMDVLHRDRERARIGQTCGIDGAIRDSGGPDGEQSSTGRTGHLHQSRDAIVREHRCSEGEVRTTCVQLSVDGRVGRTGDNGRWCIIDHGHYEITGGHVAKRIRGLEAQWCGTNGEEGTTGQTADEQGGSTATIVRRNGIRIGEGRPAPSNIGGERSIHRAVRDRGWFEVLHFDREGALRHIAIAIHHRPGLHRVARRERRTAGDPCPIDLRKRPAGLVIGNDRCSIGVRGCA